VSSRSKGSQAVLAARPEGRRQSPRSARASGIVVTILVIAGLFEAVSDNLVHAGFLFAVALALSVDKIAGERWVIGPPARSTRIPLTRRAERLLVLALLLYAAITGFFGRFTWPITVAVLVPGAAAVVLGWRGGRPDRADPPLTRWGALQWTAVFVAIALWELTNLLLQPSLRTDSHAHPTMSVLMDPVLATHLGRTVTLALWLGIGWFLMER
jgi:hypothetical protein